MTKGRLLINGKEFVVRLADNETTSQLIYEHFPLEMNMQELNGNEKYFYLPTEVRFNKEVKDIHAGDIKLYGNDCIVLFYRDTKSHYKYTDIGTIENTFGLEEALGEGSVYVQFMLK
jgi:hypothetical protein